MSNLLARLAKSTRDRRSSLTSTRSSDAGSHSPELETIETESDNSLTLKNPSSSPTSPSKRPTVDTTGGPRQLDASNSRSDPSTSLDSSNGQQGYSDQVSHLISPFFFELNS